MKQDLIDAINNHMPELKTIDKADVLELIKYGIYDRTRTQVWAITDDTVPLSLGVFEDIAELSIPIKMFGDNVTIEFEDEIVYNK